MEEGGDHDEDHNEALEEEHDGEEEKVSDMVQEFASRKIKKVEICAGDAVNKALPPAVPRLHVAVDSTFLTQVFSLPKTGEQKLL